MKQTLNLTRILLKSSFNKNLNDNNSKKKQIPMTILIVMAVLYLACIIGYFSYEIINSLKSINQEVAFLSFCLLVSIGITLFRTIFTSLNVLYFSKDVEFLLPLPIKPIKIVFAKFNVMLISEYITELITFIIPFAVYGYIMQASISFYIYSLLIFLMLPVIPMLLLTLIIVVIMKFTNFIHNKDILQYLSVILTIGIVIVIQFVSTSSNQVTNFMIANKLIEINGMADTFSRYFFTLEQAIDIITNTQSVEAIKNMILLIMESILSYVLIAFIVSKIYIQSAINVTTSGIKRRKIKNHIFLKKSTALSYVKKEMKILFRNPIFFLQCVLPTILLPVLFFIPIYRSIASVDVEQLKIFGNALAEALQQGMGMGVILVIINFLYMFNYISVTSISRDGESATFMKYIPVELYSQCKYKAIPSILLNMIPLLFVIGIIIYFVKNIIWITVLEIFILGLLFNVLISYIAIFIDVLRPKLHWTSEYSVVKQNMNMLYYSICVFVIIGIILVVCAYLNNLHVITGVLAGITIFVLLAYELFLRRYTRQIFKKVC